MPAAHPARTRDAGHPRRLASARPTLSRESPAQLSPKSTRCRRRSGQGTQKRPDFSGLAGWGTWTRTKNKRIRIFRVANYTIPQWFEPESEPIDHFTVPERVGRTGAGVGLGELGGSRRTRPA